MRSILRSTTLRLLVVFSALTLVGLAACGDDDSGDDAAPVQADDSSGADSDGDAGSDSSDDGGTDAPAPSGGGTATLTIGDETWEFTTVRCAIGSDQTQSDEYDFSLSAIENGLQLSVDRAAEGGQYGDGVEIDDIEDFENPSVSRSAPAFDPTGGQSEPFVQIDGKNVTAESMFTDGTLDDPFSDPTPGTLEATCP